MQTDELIKSFSNSDIGDHEEFKMSVIGSLKSKFKYSSSFANELPGLGLNPDMYLFENNQVLNVDKNQMPNFPPHDFQKHIKDQSIKLLLNVNSP